jgi:Cof subfamily protein (haloacid dehalogenase superfamily)
MPTNARCRVLAVDLDGTLISNAEDPARPVSATNLNALKALRAAGTRVVIITGRNEGSARSLLARCADPELAASDLILHNGALIVDGAGGDTLLELRLPGAEARRYLAVYRAHGLTPMAFADRARGGACLVEGEPSAENTRLARYLAVRRREGEGELRSVADLEGLLAEDPLALATVDTPARIAPAREAMAALALPGSRVAVQGLVGRGGHGPAQFLEVFHREAAKDKAFATWCGLRGIDLAETAAIGDGRNDLELLRAVGTGIAMGNGSAELRAAADHVAPPHDQDGLAVAIHAHLLG